MTHTTEQERAECPACGGKPVMRSTSDVDGMRWHHVECSGCGLRTRGKWVSHYSEECPLFFQEVWSEWPKPQAARRSQVVPEKESLRECAMFDLSYANGMLAGWNFCVADDDAGFKKARSSRMLEGVNTLKQLAAAPQPPEAAPVQMPEPDINTANHAGLCIIGYTPESVRQLLAAQQFTLDELAMLTRKLVQQLRKASPGNESAEKALDYLKRKGLAGNPLRTTQELST